MSSTSAARFSPDGSKVAFTASDASFANTQLYLVDLESPSDMLRMNTANSDAMPIVPRAYRLFRS
jgi:Tol biopolymer transport system component